MFRPGSNFIRFCFFVLSVWEPLYMLLASTSVWPSSVEMFSDAQHGASSDADCRIVNVKSHSNTIWGCVESCWVIGAIHAAKVHTRSLKFAAISRHVWLLRVMYVSPGCATHLQGGFHKADLYYPRWPMLPERACLKGFPLQLLPDIGCLLSGSYLNFKKVSRKPVTSNSLSFQIKAVLIKF